jgi:hypothetical protein
MKPEETKKAVDLALAGDFPVADYSQSQRTEVVNELKYQEQCALKRREHGSAKAYSAAYTKIIIEAQRYALLGESKTRFQKLEDDLSKAKQYAADLENRWAKVLQVFQKHADAERLEIAEKESARNRGSRKANRPEVPQSFRKYSREYRDLLYIEKHLYALKRYEEASQCSVKAAQLKAIEDKQIENEWFEHLRQESLKAMTTHKEEIRRMEEALQKEESTLKRDMQKELDDARARVKHIQAMLEKESKPFTGEESGSRPRSCSLSTRIHEPVPRLNLNGLNWSEFRSPRSVSLKRWVNSKMYASPRQLTR